jgi:formate--tetrahydrofolate ligase
VAYEYGAEAIVCTHWAEGSAGAEELAQRLAHLVDSGVHQFAPLYNNDMTLWDKVKTIATHLYDADDIIADKKIRTQFAELQAAGYGEFPVCMAKTQYSFSTDPNLKGAPSHHVVPIRELRLAGGAEFLVVICGEIMTMPGLPRVPAAHHIGMDDNGEVIGLS